MIDQRLALGACVLPPPHPKSPHLDPPYPNRPSWTPPPPLVPPANGERVGGGNWPKPRTPPPPRAHHITPNLIK